MTENWPSFVTRDLGDTDKDDADMLRRWKVYDREMRELIATGKFHQDGDGWWVETATGELVGPDPEIERPSTAEELASAKPFREALPELAASMDREIARRGRPPLAVTKKPVTIRLDPDVIDKFKATGSGWQSRMNDVLKAAKV